MSLQAKEVEIVKKKYKVAAAIGTSNNDINRAKYLLDSGVDLIVIDTAHGHSKKVLGMLELKRFHQKKLSVLEILLLQRQHLGSIMQVQIF